MTTFHTEVKFGEHYADGRTSVSGEVNAVIFHENGCIDIELEWGEDTASGAREAKRAVFPEHRLVTSDAEVRQQSMDLESDIVLGRKYRDVQTGIVGNAATVEFHESMATRVMLRSVGTDRNGVATLKYHMIDDFLLQDVETNEQAGRKGEKRSPATQQVSGPTVRR